MGLGGSGMRVRGRGSCAVVRTCVGVGLVGSEEDSGESGGWDGSELLNEGHLWVILKPHHSLLPKCRSAHIWWVRRKSMGL